MAITTPFGSSLPANCEATASSSAWPIFWEYAMSRYSCTKGDFVRNVSSDFRFGSATAPCEPAATGRPMLRAAQTFCTPTDTMYLRKSTHSGGALYEHEKPSPPPRAAPATPFAPGMAGKGNQPRFLPMPFLLGERPFITPGSQWPCSSMAALPLPIRPAELPAPCWAGVPRKPRWNGSTPSSCLTASPAFTQQESVKLYVTADFCSTDLLQ